MEIVSAQVKSDYDLFSPLIEEPTYSRKEAIMAKETRRFRNNILHWLWLEDSLTATSEDAEVESFGRSNFKGLFSVTLLQRVVTNCHVFKMEETRRCAFDVRSAVELVRKYWKKDDQLT
jgi:hypothetical protein